MIPEVPELVSDVVSVVGAAGKDGAGVVAVTDAAIPFCAGTNL